MSYRKKILLGVATLCEPDLDCANAAVAERLNLRVRAEHLALPAGADPRLREEIGILDVAVAAAEQRRHGEAPSRIVLGRSDRAC